MVWLIALSEGTRPMAISRESRLLFSSSRRKRFSPRWIVSGGSVVLLLVVWYLVTGPLGLLNSIQFPSPSETKDALSQLVRFGYADGTLIQHILSSSELVIWGF